MSNVVHLQPTCTGTAICRACKYEWEAVIPAGQIYFECPNCNEHKAVFKHTFAAGEGEFEYACNCGSQDFYIHKKTICSVGVVKCRMCGVEATGWFE